MYDKSQVQRILSDKRIARRTPAMSEDVRVSEEGGKKIEVDGETLYLVEGDILLDADQLRVYSLQQEALRSARALDLPGFGRDTADELLGIKINGKVVRWPLGSVLTYAVLRQSFSQSEYEEAVSSMKLATAGWEATCGVRFEHRDAADDAPPGAPVPSVLFTVRCVSGAPFIAAAFFPNDPPNRRRLLIDRQQYFGMPPQPLGFDRVGVLRHELGHVLGFRHEHIRSGAPPVCPDEPLFDTIPLTAYDPRSVMHYFCGNRGTRELQISDTDRKGAEGVYGPPLTAMEFAEIPDSAR